MLDEIKKVAVNAAKQAGAKLLEEFQIFSRKDARLKSGREIVTQADKISEEIIIKQICKSFPKHSILAEESGEHDKDSKYLWVVDPLDGTTNFSFHNPLWAVSIGVFKDKEAVVGVVYSPILDEVFVAVKGQGATLNQEKIIISRTEKAKEIHTFCHSAGERSLDLVLKYYDYQKRNGFDCRQLGSAALELSFVAAGRVESFMVPGLNAWDVAAGALFVKEAGGKVTDFMGQDWNLESKDILASNGRDHEGLLEIIAGL